MLDPTTLKLKIKFEQNNWGGSQGQKYKRQKYKNIYPENDPRVPRRVRVGPQGP